MAMSYLVTAAARRQPFPLLTSSRSQCIRNKCSASSSKASSTHIKAGRSVSLPVQPALWSPPLATNYGHLLQSTTLNRSVSSSFRVRSFSSGAEPSTPPDVKLYQYHICPFCNITKSLLSYSKLDYDHIEVNPLTKAELKPWSGDYRKVPIAVIDGNQVNGSEDIIGAILNLPHAQHSLETRWSKEISEDNQNASAENIALMDMKQFYESENATRWFQFAADDLAALLYPNICGSLSDSYNAFGYVNEVDTFSGVQKVAIRSLGALAMYMAASKVKSKRNITDEKEALRLALDKFEREGLKDGSQPFSSGHHTPDMGDVAVFGVLYSVRGLDAHTNAIQVRGGSVKKWYDRMHQQVLGKEAEHQIKLGVSCK